MPVRCCCLPLLVFWFFFIYIAPHGNATVAPRASFVQSGNTTQPVFGSFSVLSCLLVSSACISPLWIAQGYIWGTILRCI